MKKIILDFLIAIESILIIWFPFINSGSGRPLCLIGIYIIFIFLLFSKENLKNFKTDIKKNLFCRSYLLYIIWILICSLGAYITSSHFFFDYKDYNTLIMYLIYAYSFCVIFKNIGTRNIIRKTLLFCAITLSLYSIYSYFTHTNIYTDFFSFFMNEEVAEGQFRDYTAERGISFRVYGNLNNPVFFSIELMMLLGFCCYEYIKNLGNKRYGIFLVFVICFLLISIMFTGSKSGLIPSFALLILTFYRVLGLKKILFYATCYFVVFSILMPTISSILDVDLNSFFVALNPFAENVAGSTAGHRENQFAYLFKFMDDDFLFGNGYGWARHYTNINGIHPILHTFESLVMSSYVDGGLMGLCFIYPMFMIKNLKASKSYAYRLFCCAYFFTMIVTGIGCFLEFILISSYLYIDTDNKYIKLLKSK